MVRKGSTGEIFANRSLKEKEKSEETEGDYAHVASTSPNVPIDFIPTRP